jgi:hypothetical protein
VSIESNVLPLSSLRTAACSASTQNGNTIDSRLHLHAQTSDERQRRTFGDGRDRSGVQVIASADLRVFGRIVVSFFVTPGDAVR